ALPGRARPPDTTGRVLVSPTALALSLWQHIVSSLDDGRPGMRDLAAVTMRSNQESRGQQVEEERDLSERWLPQGTWLSVCSRMSGDGVAHTSSTISEQQASEAIQRCVVGLWKELFRHESARAC